MSLTHNNFKKSFTICNEPTDEVEVVVILIYIESLLITL